MKKTIVAVLFLILSVETAHSQLVNIPDPVFRAYIDSICPGAIVGASLITTNTCVHNLQDLFLSNRGITDLTGIEYFFNLRSLICDNNQLISLPPLPQFLLFLYCGKNSLTQLPSLPNGLFNLDCSFNQLSSIPILPSTLMSLICQNNINLTNIPALPANLMTFECSYCNINNLPSLPQNLNYLGCGYNPISFLPVLPNSLQNLTASGSNIWCLPNIPNNGSFNSDIGTVICYPQGTPDSWYKMTNVPGPAREFAVSFSINNMGYISTGFTSAYAVDLWEYNPVSNTWTQKANLPGAGRFDAVAFAIGRKGYVGLGQGYDFWEYDPSINVWIQKANYPGTGYSGNAAFSIGNKGYVGLGRESGVVFPVSFFEFDPVNNVWNSRANFPGIGRVEAACFTLGNKGFVCGGDGQNSLHNTCYSFDPVSNSWSQTASLPVLLNEAASFSLNGKGYVAAGEANNWGGAHTSTLYEYNPVLNAWSSKQQIPTPGRSRATGCSINSKGYIGTGSILNIFANYSKSNDWWEYTPTCSSPVSLIYSVGGATSFCSGDSLMLFAENGNIYQWKKNGIAINGANKRYYYVKNAGTYKCVLSNSCGTVISAGIAITVNSLPQPTLTSSGPVTFCSGDSVILSAPGGGGIAWQWRKNGVGIAGAISNSFTATVSGNYKVLKTNTYGCKGFSNSVQVTKNNLPASVINASGQTTFCAGDSVILNAGSGAGYNYLWKRNNVAIPGAVSINYTAKNQGNYKVKVTDVNGCTKLSNGIFVSVPCRQQGNSMENLTGNSEDIRVYPNPSSGDFKILIHAGETTPVTVNVYDVKPALVMSKVYKSCPAGEITISGLEDGVYAIYVQSGNTSRMFKVIKVK